MLFTFKCVLGPHADNFTENISIQFDDDQVNEHFDALFRDKNHRKVSFRHLPTANFLIMIGKQAKMSSSYKVVSYFPWPANVIFLH